MAHEVERSRTSSIQCTGPREGKSTVRPYSCDHRAECRGCNSWIASPGRRGAAEISTLPMAKDEMLPGG